MCFGGCLKDTPSGLAPPTGEHWREQAGRAQPKAWRTPEPPKGSCVQGVALAQTLTLGCKWAHHPRDRTLSGWRRHLYLLHNRLLKDSDKSHISTRTQPLGKIHPDPGILIPDDPQEAIGKIKTRCFQVPLKTHKFKCLP